jgi:hypothetical protein
MSMTRRQLGTRTGAMPRDETAARRPAAEPAPFLGLSLGASGSAAELLAGARMSRSSCRSPLDEAGNGSIRIEHPVVSRARRAHVSCGSVW